jgi:thioredoxin reductase (NADPH)
MRNVENSQSIRQQAKYADYPSGLSTSEASPMYDIVIVGSGPAGISLAYAAQQRGLSYLVLERAKFAQTIRDYPFESKTHSPPSDLELIWGELSSPTNFPTREETLAHYEWFALQKHRLHIRTGECVEHLEGSDQQFVLQTNCAMYEAKKVILATGGFGVPRRLKVTGENDSRVSYLFTDRRPFAGQDILVVGGGNSAAEAALQLHEGGANVVWSTRRPPFEPSGFNPDPYAFIKEWNVQALQALSAKGQMRIIYNSTVQAITDQTAVLKVESSGATEIVKCARVFALLGASPDLRLLQEAGARIEVDGRPAYNCHTYETTVPGLHVAGHISRELHIANAVLMAPHIIRAIIGEAPSSCLNRYLHDRCNRTLRKIRGQSPLFSRLVARSSRVRTAMQAFLNFLQFNSFIASLDRFCAPIPMKIPACGPLSRTTDRYLCVRSRVDHPVAVPIGALRTQDHTP